MPGWAGSSWYFLRYMDPKNKKEFASKKEMSYWKNVQVYVGGQEHATGHLLYARFWNKALYDLGYVHHKEPFDLLKNQGLILGDDNRKMSKRWGNVVNPDDIVATYGADTLRVYEAFMGPFEQMLPWSTEGIIGSRRFLEKVWRMGEKVDLKTKDSKELLSALHKAIHKVSNDITTFNFNTAVSSMMIALKEYEKAEHVSKDSFLTFLQLLAPFAPFMTEELWSMNGGKGSIHLSLWPKAKASYLKEDSIVIGVQVNGKTRGEISLSPDATEEEARVLALKDEKIIGWIGDKEIKKFIYVKGRIVNIVIG
jgi:leucyl-tRNA synthetase